MKLSYILAAKQWNYVGPDQNTSQREKHFN